MIDLGNETEDDEEVVFLRRHKPQQPAMEDENDVEELEEAMREAFPEYMEGKAFFESIGVPSPTDPSLITMPGNPTFPRSAIIFYLVLKLDLFDDPIPAHACPSAMPFLDLVDLQHNVWCERMLDTAADATKKSNGKDPLLEEMMHPSTMKKYMEKLSYKEIPPLKRASMSREQKMLRGYFDGVREAKRAARNAAAKGAKESQKEAELLQKDAKRQQRVAKKTEKLQKGAEKTQKETEKLERRQKEIERLKKEIKKAEKEIKKAEKRQKEDKENRAGGLKKKAKKM